MHDLYMATQIWRDERTAERLIGRTRVLKIWGFGLCFLPLRNVKGHPWNQNQIDRSYRDPELNLRLNPRKRLVREKPDALAVPETPNQIWSMDFISDKLGDGKGPCRRLQSNSPA